MSASPAQPRMPNFLLIGVQKSGTTSLFHYLRQHPDVYMSPIKEPSFFATDTTGVPTTPEERAIIAFQAKFFPDGMWHDTLAGYQALFAAAANERAIGEASTLYWTSNLAPRCIKHYVPQARLIVMLRDPAERAYSAFRMIKRLGIETFETFQQTLSHTEFLDPESPVDPNKHSRYIHYLENGHYFHRLRAYYALFPKENLRVYLYDDLVKDPLSVMRDIFAFLDVDAAFTPDLGTKHYADRPTAAENPAIRLFEAVVPASARAMARSLTPPALRYRYDRARGAQVGPGCPPEARERLIAYYREGLLRLQDLIGRDLGPWLAGPANGGTA